MSTEHIPERPAKPNPFFLQAAELPPVDRRHFLGLLALTCGWTMVSAAEGDKKGKGGGGKGGGGGDDQSRARGPSFQGEYVLPEALAEFSRLSVVLGRASDKTVTLSLLAAEAMEAVIELGTTPGKYARKIGPLTLPKGEPVEVVVDKLTANTEYFYRLQSRFLKASGGAFTARPECRFATQRAPGSSFIFTIQGDSHPERPQSSHPDLYARTLQAAAAERPDFHICIGDDFSVDKVRTVSPAALAQPYLLQRPFLGLIGQQAGVFLMNGNHEQGSLFNYQQTDERRDVAVGVQKARNRLFPTVGPDGFYTGGAETLKDVGPLKTYCAWTWGDALFVILDNYWHSPTLVDSGYGEKAKASKGDEKKNRDWWGITIGDAQYQWFKRTLETSKAKYKFVFAHHVLGSGRGGVDEADLYEWGGQGKRGEGAVAPDTVVPQKSAAINGHRRLQLRIQSRRKTRQVAAPTDAGNADARRIHLRKRGQQGVPPQHRRHRMIGPHVLGLVVGKVLEFDAIILTWAALRVAFAIRALPGRIHGQSHITPLRPMPGPVLKRLSPAAMHQQHRGMFAGDGAACGFAQPRENPGRFPLVRFSGIPDRFGQAFSSPGLDRRWRGQQLRHIPKGGRRKRGVLSGRWTQGQ